MAVNSQRLTLARSTWRGCLSFSIILFLRRVKTPRELFDAPREIFDALRKFRLVKTPRRADLEEITNFYKQCPKGVVVDHIIPLQGKLVSGFHILDNLQYLTKSENAKKSNKHTP